MAKKPRWTQKQIEGLLDKYGGMKAASEAEDLPLSSLYDYAARYGVSVGNHVMDKYEFQAALDHYGSWEEMGRRTGIPATTLKARGKKLGVKSPRSGPGAPKRTKGKAAMDRNTAVALATEKVSIDEDRVAGTIDAEYVEKVPPSTLDPRQAPSDKELLKRAGRDPKEWKVSGFGATVWEAQQKGGDMVDMRSMRVKYTRIENEETLRDKVLPAFGGRPLNLTPPKRVKPKGKKRGNRFIVVLSDFHAPFHDEDLLQATKQVLLESQPDELVINGDLMDLGTVSRHGKKTKYGEAEVNACIQAGGRILGELRASIPEDTKMVFLPGNHDANIAHYIYREAPGLAGICAYGEEVPVWNLWNLLRFDELNIELIGNEEIWSQNVYELCDRLVIRHGKSVRKGAGASVIANMVNADFASITGHTHRQGVVAITRNEASRKHKILFGGETGGMFRLPKKPTDWPQYEPHDSLDWQTGWLSVDVEADGHYNIDIASWQNGVLMWRGQRY